MKSAISMADRLLDQLVWQDITSYQPAKRYCIQDVPAGSVMVGSCNLVIFCLHLPKIVIYW